VRADSPAAVEFCAIGLHTLVHRVCTPIKTNELVADRVPERDAKRSSKVPVKKKGLKAKKTLTAKDMKNVGVKGGLKYAMNTVFISSYRLGSSGSGSSS
jgi:hypothetical protein